MVRCCSDVKLLQTDCPEGANTKNIFLRDIYTSTKHTQIVLIQSAF